MEDQPGAARHGVPGGAEPPERRPAPRPPGVRVGHVRGAPIFVSPLAVVFAALIASLLIDRIRRHLAVDATDGQVVALALLISVGFVLSLLAHEIGHALTAQRFGLHVRSVTLHGFAGFTEFEPEPPTAGREFLIAFAGPAVNGVIGGVCFLGLLAVSDHGSLGTVLLYLGAANVALFVLNLAPGLPLDGGRVVVAVVWAVGHDKLRGLRAGAYGGFAVAGGLAVAGARAGSGGGFAALYWYVLAGFVAFGAYQSLRSAKVRERLPGLSAGRLARRTLPVEATVPLGEALRRAQEVGATAVAVIDRDGTPLKIMNGVSVDALPEHRRPWMAVDEVSRSIGPGMTLQAELEGEDLLAAVQRTPAAEYLVVQRGRPVGVLAMVDLVARIDPAAAARMVSHR
ncbi:site-2 protease family protein [Parafrankia discariae]|uniref:site-2 protease family protein n=1 Tax=Parafrankia discariae TaxID=365528 RepID=UPI000366518E|nr:site-2 protease family protein [Parafrankia discariae]